MGARMQPALASARVPLMVLLQVVPWVIGRFGMTIRSHLFLTLAVEVPLGYILYRVSKAVEAHRAKAASEGGQGPH